MLKRLRFATSFSKGYEHLTRKNYPEAFAAFNICLELKTQFRKSIENEFYDLDIFFAESAIGVNQTELARSHLELALQKIPPYDRLNPDEKSYLVDYIMGVAKRSEIELETGGSNGAYDMEQVSAKLTKRFPMRAANYDNRDFRI